MKENALNLSFYKGEDLYSDGEIEDEILKIVKEQKDYTDILNEDDRWALLYHLSPFRHNILEWYEFGEGKNLLEIGAGCGAVSGLFCKKLNRVVGIELSKKRSTINAERNSDFDNLEIYVGNFEDVVLEEKFDYVTLIGVLEYSPLYINSKHPFDDMLKRVKDFLKPDGKVLIAIENKMGLKYLAGAPEDHTGVAFDGVDDYQNITHVKTLTKNELNDLLLSVGFKDIEFYYPMPDYKFPKVIYSDHCLPKAGDLGNIKQLLDRDRLQTFDDEIVYNQLCSDGKFDYFANSFLVEAKV